jgi:hypothetical protein
VGNVAKHKASPAEPETEKRVQVSIDADLVRKARMVAGSLGISLPDLVNARLRPVIEAELQAMLRDMGLGK